ncbi:MmcQ/YjbR family DNA-binding protein [Nonomuraea phyllanthi]|uniref:MmcQ/YjbR family DNA-binding protein n=1 Tax=Nonomuraea phyllanthi TaxID=2219224 RepID=A0A5C4VD44_9ACTN|nr:MmcQ/YjbR family DNA-binding protein [Nonomuraea phyllanthi]KAB8188491.1 MmcQ/YjbR family DNA-binding protein [Nonomuraea phyllanthi]QFY09767.1 MmcQ/YjbR family DNA-binding protein [Nonomuraea phyllanthi]
MDEQQLQQVAHDTATALPGVTFEHRTNPNWETYKVAGKVFLLMTDLPGHAVVTVKADPRDAVALREQYEEISAGYHTDKRHWVSAAAGPGIDDTLIRGLVTDSYGLVVDKLPKTARPTTTPSDTGRTS